VIIRNAHQGRRGARDIANERKYRSSLHASCEVLAETAVPVLGEGRMIRHAAIEPEPAEPPIRQIEVDFLAQASLGADAKAVADNQHPHH